MGKKPYLHRLGYELKWVKAGPEAVRARISSRHGISDQERDALVAALEEISEGCLVGVSRRFESAIELTFSGNCKHAAHRLLEAAARTIHGEHRRELAVA